MSSLSLQDLEAQLELIKKANADEPEHIKIPVHPHWIDKYGVEGIKRYAEANGFEVTFQGGQTVPRRRNILKQPPPLPRIERNAR